ncbi:riboflavin synthase subunit alpha [Corynebacterium glutamicum MT]|uniref:Riboflavin synthase n=1 Tax=Corynebacterium glutamicum TaxID=1718 RepID=A0AB36IGU7_CORGT|nr:riboflavin synthase [Corynebacterium glutamicum]AGN19322.1 riboflavin synthase subunit alpha [Corynebacterium glutamicum SCgG1]AGN22347.1 riboflavin synthase subunit alpha [Corynebacterium glutamicum SCgG2]EGV40631.1 riboflavin synthase subunit alpha [Corynebacterium glutamicum S9114]EOA65559.1 riboflavin synthase subunit alpha [Corynebacterium glutamicum MT]EPP40533.1 riboflavin synthase subunit alpha [Corynebacterium glutamicum Z188]
MFTGIVEELGSVAGVEHLGDSIRMQISASTVLEGVHLGDSISVNGVCLTVASFDEGHFTADLMQETLDRSSLGALSTGSKVNLERAMAADGRLGGHIMQGHVDATTTLIKRTSSENWDVLRFELPADLARYVVEKGSIALNGTSLTVSSLGDDWFEVSLIPTTLRDTTHGELAVGDIVNIEVDVIAKCVERMMTRGVAGNTPNDYTDLTRD